MNILSVRHKGLKNLLEHDDPKGIEVPLQKRVRAILAVLVSAKDIDGVKGPPGWNVHELKGDRANTWSVSVSGNWRVTFELVEPDGIRLLDLEDYH